METLNNKMGKQSHLAGCMLEGFEGYSQRLRSLTSLQGHAGTWQPLK